MDFEMICSSEARLRVFVQSHIIGDEVKRPFDDSIDGVTRYDSGQGGRKAEFMLSRLIAIALATETLLVCVEGVVAVSTRYLPIGGSHLAQLGFVLGLAVVVTHLWSSVRKS
jgi:hypothetical protein